MHTATEPAKKPMTSDDLFAMRPSKKVDRWLFRGELRETKVTRRNPNHSRTVTYTASLLVSLLRTRPAPRGEIYTGDAYFRLRRDPDTNFGIDIALSSPEQKVKTTKKSGYIDGPPVLAVEVLSPYDKVKELHDKIDEYLECGVQEIWIIDPYDETLKVYRPDIPLRVLTASDPFADSPNLPGLKFNIPELFG